MAVVKRYNQTFTANADGDWLHILPGRYMVKLTVDSGSFAGTVTASFGDVHATAPTQVAAITGLSLAAVGATSLDVPEDQMIRFTKGGTALASGVTATVSMHRIERY